MGGTLIVLHKIYDDEGEVTVGVDVTKGSNLRERVASVVNELEGMNVDLHTMMGSVTDAAQMWQDLDGERKNIDSRGAKLVL